MDFLMSNVKSRCIFTILALVGSLVDASQLHAAEKTIGLVLTHWRPAIYQSQDGPAQCPEGLQPSNTENWQAQYSNPAEREKAVAERVRLGPGSVAGDSPKDFMQSRGPKGENIVYNPMLAEDPIPFREVQSKVAYGMDLDGRNGSTEATDSCPHDDFTSPDGQPGIDNQLYRLYGCAQGWIKGGFKVDNVDGTPASPGKFQDVSQNRVLIEITDVDNEENDDYVEVTFYKGIDGLLIDSSGQAVPNRTHRIDSRFPKYVTMTTGKIVNGVLKTQPVDAHFSAVEAIKVSERVFREMRVELSLNKNGAKGLLGGYEDIDAWYARYAKNWGFVAEQTGNWSPPSFYRAALRFADGHPDAETRRCTSISVAHSVKAVRAFIVLPPPGDVLLGRYVDEFEQAMNAMQRVRSNSRAGG